MSNLAYGTFTITNLSVVTSVDVYYYNSTSSTSLSGGSWQTTTPTWTNGKYIWSKTVTTWEQGVTTQSQPVCITGQKGSTGSTGQSVTSIIEQYALSTSNTTAPITGWSNTMPVFEANKYYWTRSKITWANPTNTTYTDAVLANGITSANTTANAANTTAAQANQTANTANQTANTANQTANAASQTAADAASAAAAAQSTANNATSIANGKNTIYYGANFPAGGTYKAGDTFFKQSAEGYIIYKYDTTDKQWVKESLDEQGITQITNAKIANLDGGKINAGTITSLKLSTDAIKSRNYQAGTAPYSATGTFLDLTQGNIYTPNFGVNNDSLDSIDDGAYIRGSIYAHKGTIGQSSTNYWYIGNYKDYNQVNSAMIKGYGTATIQLGESNTWRLNTNRIHTAWNDDSSANEAYRLHYLIRDSKYWDMGLHVPTSGIDKFIYIRSSKSDTSTANILENLQNSLEDNLDGTNNYWTYKFFISADGGIYARNIYAIDENGNYTLISGANGAYLLKSGGTIQNNLVINGTLQVKGNYLNKNGSALTLQTNLGSTTAGTLTGNTSSAISIGVTGTLPSSSGGTGNTNWNQGGVVYIDGSSPKKLLSTAAGTSGYLLKANGTGAPTWINPATLTVAAATKATQDGDGNVIKTTYLKLSGGNVTGPVSFGDSVSIDDLNAGTLVVTGNASFVNGINTTNVNGGQPIYTVIGTQTATTASWTGNLPITALYDGLTIAYYLPRTSANNVTLNLTLANGTTTGAIPVYITSTTRMTTHYGAGSTILLTYWSAGSISVNGTATTQNRWTGGDYWDGNDTGYYHRRIYPNIKAGAGKIYPYTLIMQRPDGRWESLVTSNSTGTAKERNTNGFLLGHVLLMYANATYSQNNNVGTYNIWSAHSGLIDHRYSFNTANDSTNGTTGYKPIYLVGTIGSDGLFYLDTKWWTQTLPSSVDNKVYIYIGDAYDYYRMTFTEDKPIYCYYNGGIKLYTGLKSETAASNGTNISLVTTGQKYLWNSKTSNTGTVTSVAASGSGGITIGGSPITTSGTLAIGLNLSTAINGLGEGTSAANRNDYAVVQFAGGGTTTTSYHRRKLSNVFAALNSSDITTALGFTPYNATNPNGYTSNTGTVTSVQVQASSPLQSSTSTAQSSSLNTTISFVNQNANVILAGPSSGNAATPAFRALVAADIPSLTKSKISDFPTTWALSSVTGADDLKAIEALTGTSGFLKKTAANTWSLDTNTYVTSSGVTSITLTQGTGISIGSSGTAITSTGTRTISLADNYGDTKNPYASKTARYVLAAPAAQAGAPTFRVLTKDDVGLNNVLNYAQITAIGQGDNGTLRVWTGDPTSTNTNDYEDIALTITAYSQSTVSKAAALNLSAAVGSTSKPVYFKADGKPYEISYTIEKSVPSNAVFTDTTYNFADSYNASSNKGATVATITNAINNLDVTAITGTTGQTITSISETNGKISATYSNISITKSQISDFPSTMTPAAHTHDDRYYTETEINNKFTALTNTTTQINHIKFYSGSCNAGKTYIGWIKIASFPMNNSNQLGENSYEFGIYRGYSSLSSESYNIKINTGWDNASIIQLNGRAGNQIIEKFRLVKDNTNHICYFEMYVNTNYTTYQNNVNLRIQKWNNDSLELTLLNTVQTEADSDFQVVSTLDLEPKGIVSNNNFYGNLIGTADIADIANSVAWNNITSKPINFITNTGALNTNGWKTLGGRTTQSSIAISYATSSSATWNSGAFSSSIVFGCQDTKGMVDIGYTSPVITFGGGSVGGSTDNAPKWYFKLSGTSEQLYTFPTTSKTLAATDGSNASGSWGISITGNASTATEFSSNATVTLTGDTTGTSAGSKKSWSIATTTTKLSQTTATALNSFTDTTALIYTAAGGSNTITDKPTSVDAFGCLSLKTADGWYGQLLISSNTATGLYWRTATSLSGGWKKLLDSNNYTDYTVKKDGTGASGSWGISITGNAATASKITNLTGTDNASSSDTWRKVWISYNDGVTGRPAVSENLVFKTSTNTLKSSHFYSEHISGGNNEFRVTYGSTIDMAMMVGSSNENHGLYDHKVDKWMIYADINGNVTVNGNATTASKLGTSNIGASDRPIYLSAGTATQTTYRMAATNAAATTALGIDTNLNTGIWYVNGTNSTNLYSQSDGVAYVNKYSDSWIHEIYGDYRTGQIAVRGKNNGTWQAWRKILDSSNYTNYMGNYVTLNTAQTISGTKTFTGGISMKSSSTTNACNINYNSSLNALVFSFV